MELPHTSFIDARNGISNVAGQDLYNYVVQDAQTTAEILQNLQPVHMDASNRNKCLEGTRVATIQFILDWASDPDGTQNVLWLHGLAGVGKSTLATTMATHFRNQRRLGAFLFFDRAVTERSNPFAVIRTLAHQVGTFHPSAGQSIADAIDESPSICLCPLRDQFQQLLVKPLSSEGAIIANAPIILILDALDECGTAKEREVLLEVLTEQSVELPPAIRILITSRSDINSHDTIQSQSQSNIFFHELKITSDDNAEDISCYLRHRIEFIRRKRRDLTLVDWPGEDNIQKLITRAYGLFVWASTAMEFIDGYEPRGRLETILKGENVSGAQSALNSLYATALESLGIWDDAVFVADFTVIVGLVLVARRPLSTAAIDMLLGLPRNRPCRYTVSHLGCVLQQPIVRLLHPSFADFLLDRSRCGHEVWFFDPLVHNRQLAIRCLDHLAEVLDENMCNLTLSENMKNETLSEGATYACDFWIDHICTIGGNVESIGELLRDFLFRHLLHWFEAMSILRRSRDTISMLERLTDWIVDRHVDLDGLYELAQDACRFAAVFAESIEEHPLLVYMAALPFTPTNTMLYQNFHDANPNASMLQSFGPASSTLMRVFIQHGWSDSRIRSVAFSPDGTRVITGSFDKLIRIWNIDGAEIIKLQGHEGWVNSVDISPNGTRIASGSQDETLRIWDVTSGVEVLPALQGHNGAILSVAFSPNGTQVVSGSSDKTIRLWSATEKSNSLRELQGHQGGVWSLAFFPDGTRIVSASSDKTTRVWDLTSGSEIFTLRGHEHPVMSVGISADGTRIISGSYNNHKRIWDTVSGLQVSEKNDPAPWFWSEIEDEWILDPASRKKLFKIPSMVKTRFWLLEQLTVRYWFCGFRPHSVQEEADENEVCAD